MKINLENKILYQNIALFILLFYSFCMIYVYLQEVNFEFQYQNYLKEKEQSINLILNNNSSIQEQEPETFKIGKGLLIAMCISIIIILDQITYFIKKYLENKRKWKEK